VSNDPTAEDDRVAREIVDEWRSWVKAREYGPTDPLGELSLHGLTRLIAEGFTLRRQASQAAE